ncbi:MAG: hypothetical protein PVF68_03265 [Acidobacteriota bacterium]|jgi:hypothetical protein
MLDTLIHHRRLPFRPLPLLLVLALAGGTLCAADAVWTTRQLDRDGFVIAAEGITADGEPLMLTVVPTRIRGELQVRTTYVRGDRGLVLTRSYSRGELHLEALHGEDRLRARMWPALHGGVVVEYDLPDGRQLRVAANPDDGMLAGDVAQLAEAFAAPRALFRMLRAFHADRSTIGSGMIGGLDVPGWQPEILGGTSYDRCVTECAAGCRSHCSLECALDPLVACKICTAACGAGCAIGCFPKMHPIDDTNESSGSRLD